MILSIDTPDKPSLIATYPKSMFDNGYVHEMYAKNDTGYLSCGYNGLMIYDFRNPLKPVFITSLSKYPEYGFNHSPIISKDGNYLYFTDEDYTKKMKVFSLKKTRNPKSVSKTPEYEALFGLPSHGRGAVAHNQYVVGDLMYVAYYQEGVAMFDISNPIDPQLIDQYDTYPQNINFDGFEGCWNVYPYYPSKRFIASDQANGLFLFKLDTISSINDNVNQKIQSKIYQPNENNIIIDNKDNFENVLIYNIDGKLICENDLNFGINNISILQNSNFIIIELKNKNIVHQKKLYIK
jgi:hypothetical protein